MPKTYDWFWQGTRGTNRMLGHLYHNIRDGWMYVEDLRRKKKGASRAPLDQGSGLSRG
jgi:hypothetical protein